MSSKTWTPPPETQKALEKYLRRALDKNERQAIVDRFPIPSIPVAKTPSLDNPIQQVMTQRRIGIKNIPGALAVEAVQSRMLDSLGPFSAVHAAAIKAKANGELLNPDAVLESINHGLVLLGNANSQAIFQRQRSVINKLNPNAVSHISKTTIPVPHSTELFGPEVRKSIKDAADVRKDFGLISNYQQRPSPSFRGRYSNSQPRSFRHNPYERRGRSTFTKPPNSFGQPSFKGEFPFMESVSEKVKFWKTITDDPWVLSCIEGYKIPFHTQPDTNFNPAPHITNKGEELVDNEVKSLIQKGAIEIAKNRYFLNQIFLVPKRDSESWRPILNLKPLNKFISNFHFKLESITMLTDLLGKDMWMCKLDLKDAYFSIPVRVSDRKFLQFVWNDITYQYTCLPFGLCTAPYVFTKVTKPLSSYLRRSGILLIMYLDDCLIVDGNREKIIDSTRRVIKLFENAGFVINYEKSVLRPTKIIEFLGIIVDSSQMSFGLPPRKCEKIRQSANYLLQTPYPSARTVAAFIGQITAARLALRKSNLKIRQLQYCLIQQLRQNQNWEQVLYLSESAKQELHWWKLQGEFPSSPIHLDDPTLEIASDSSLEGWGAVCQSQRTGGHWSEEDLRQYKHINQLELLAAFLAIRCFWKAPCRSVKIFTDNKSAVTYINKMGGTRSPALNSIALQLWEWCVTNDVWVTAEYLPGKDNVLADWESRHFQDYSAWKLNVKIFCQIRQQYSLEVDLFADRNNYQLPHYWSWKPDPDSQGTDSFTTTWKNLKAYAFPPFCLVGRCLQKCQQDQADIVLIAPVWSNQFWYPALLKHLYALPLLLPQMSNLLTDCHNHHHPMIQQQRLQLAVWPVSGVMQKVQTFQNKLKQFYSTQSEENQENHMKVFGDPLLAGVVNNRLIHFKQLKL